MADTIKRLAGPVAASKLNAGAAIYTPSSGVTAVVRSALVANTHGSKTGWITLGVGAVDTLANRFISALEVPPRSSILLPLDLVVSNGGGDSIFARQTMAQDASGLVVANKVATASTTATTAYASGSWTATNDNTVYVLSVIHTLATAPAAPSSITDTHSGVTWQSLQTITNAAAGTNGEFIRIDQYRAQSTGTTNTTTTANFAVNQTGCIVVVDEVRGGDTSGSDGSEAILPLGTVELAGTLQSLQFGCDPFGLRHALTVHGVNEVHTPGTGMTELSDTGYSTPNTAEETAYTFSPYIDLSASWATTATRRLGAAVGFQDSLKALTVTLNGVEAT